MDISIIVNWADFEPRYRLLEVPYDVGLKQSAPEESVSFLVRPEDDAVLLVFLRLD